MLISISATGSIQYFVSFAHPLVLLFIISYIALNETMIINFFINFMTLHYAKADHFANLMIKAFKGVKNQPIIFRTDFHQTINTSL